MNLNHLITEVYDKCAFETSDVKFEKESKEYDACRFKLDGRNIISRSAKTTPKKNGQFVTFWKRNGDGIIKPFNENDEFDFYAIHTRMQDKEGQFVLPKSVLIEKGIISTKKKEGKRGFRVYPHWEIAQNKQAEKTQKWQLDYFFEINTTTDFNKVMKLYKIE